MTPIGQTPPLQPGLIQNQPQSQTQKQPVRQDTAQRQETQGRDVLSSNTNFQKLAEDILAKRAAGEATQRPAVERGQVLDIIV